MSRSNKTAGGGAKPAAAPKALAANASTADLSATTAGAAAAGAASSGGVSVAPEGAQSSGAETSALGVSSALAAVFVAFDAIGPAVHALIEAYRAASPSDRRAVREALLDASGSQSANYETVGSALEEIMTEPDDVELVEITARSRDGKPFRRAGLAWSDTYRTVHVPADVAEKLAGDPNLLVKPGR